MRPGQSSSQPPGPFPELAGRTILQIIPELDAGGAERTTVDVAAALAASGARALVALRGRPARRRVAGARAASGFRSRRSTKNPLTMALNVAAVAEAAPRRGRAISSMRARALRPGWRWAPRARLKLPFVTTYHGAMPERVRGQGALQFGDGARRRRDRQLVLHARPHRRACIRSRGIASRRPSRHRSARLPPEQVAAERVQTLRRDWGVEPARAHRPARRAPHRLEGPARPGRRRQAARQTRPLRRRASSSPATSRAATAMSRNSTRGSRPRA